MISPLEMSSVPLTSFHSEPTAWYPIIANDDFQTCCSGGGHSWWVWSGEDLWQRMGGGENEDPFLQVIAGVPRLWRAKSKQLMVEALRAPLVPF